MTKAEIRQKVWQTIQREGAARFPGALGRVPNFAGAERAAQLLREMAVWRRALVVKVNPDAPQLAVRRLALAEGKILYMAVPRLRTEKCFVEIDPQRLGKKAALAASAVRFPRRCGSISTKHFSVRRRGTAMYKILPSASARRRTGSCGASGFTLTTSARRHTAISRSNCAACSAPAKFGTRPSAPGNRAAPSR